MATTARVLAVRMHKVMAIPRSWCIVCFLRRQLVYSLDKTPFELYLTQTHSRRQPTLVADTFSASRESPPVTGASTVIGKEYYAGGRLTNPTTTIQLIELLKMALHNCPNKFTQGLLFRPDPVFVKLNENLFIDQGRSFYFKITLLSSQSGEQVPEI